MLLRVKQLLSLSCAALIATSASALDFPINYDGAFNWSWGCKYDYTTQTIEYTGDWGAAGWWLKDGPMGDLSAYTDVVITTEPTGINGWLVVAYTNPDGSDPVNESFDYPVGATEISAHLNADRAADITGIYIAAAQLTDKPIITIIKAEAVDNSGLPQPAEKKLTITWDHNVLSSEFDALADDTKIKIHIKNTTDPYQGRNGWGIGQISYFGYWGMTDNSFPLVALDGPEFDIYCTAADLKKAAKDGTDSYIPNEYFEEGGVTIQTYNDCELVAVYAMMPQDEGSTAVTDIINNQDVDNKIYDVYGHVMTNPSKGIYILKGKKFIIR